MQAHERLEAEFAEYIGTEYAVSVNSGTSALTLAIAALGIGEGDEVIVPEFTMIACAWAVTYNRATPVFVDCGEDLNIDVAKIEAKITPRTKAIMPVHIYGRPADLRAICAIAEKHGLYVIEDAAEAHGAHVEGKKVGSWGTVGCFSFYRNKIVHAEEGGIITTNDRGLYELMRDMRSMSFGSRHDYLHERMGFNFRMPNAEAEMALRSLGKVEESLERRWETVERLDRNMKAYTLPRPDGSVPWVYDFVWRNPAEKEFAWNRLAAESPRHFFKPMSMQPMYLGEYRDLKAFDFSERGMYLQIKV